MKIFLYGHKIKDDDNLSYVSLLRETIEDLGGKLYVFGLFLTELSASNPNFGDLPAVDSYEELKQAQPDVVLTMGGDGTILHAITLVKDSGIPILGINLGRLGFLASVEKKSLKKP